MSSRSTTHTNPKREKRAIAKLKDYIAKHGIKQTALKLSRSEAIVRFWYSGEYRPNIFSINAIESLRSSNGRRKADQASKSTVRDTHAAYKGVAREVRHITTLISRQDGGLSENLTTWTRHRIQTSGERLIAATINLIAANRKALK